MLPSSAEYWHIGETTMRFGSVTPPSWSGLKRAEFTRRFYPSEGEKIKIKAIVSLLAAACFVFPDSGAG